jgi:hypothetical protein
MYGISDLDAVLNSSGSFPLAEVYRQATGSSGATFGLLFIVLLNMLVCNITTITASPVSCFYARMLLTQDHRWLADYSGFWQETMPPHSRNILPHPRDDSVRRIVHSCRSHPAGIDNGVQQSCRLVHHPHDRQLSASHSPAPSHQAEKHTKGPLLDGRPGIRGQRNRVCPDRVLQHLLLLPLRLSGCAHIGDEL